MDKQQLISSIDPELYEKLKMAVETGKWANGVALSREQKENALALVIAWDQTHKEEQERVGYIYTEKHDHCGSDGGDWKPIKFDS